MRRITILLCLSFLFPHWSTAGDPVITARVDRNTANLGDEITFTADLHFEAGWDFDLKPLDEAFGDATVLKSHWSKPVRVPETGLHKVTLTASLAWYKLGTFTIPPLLVKGGQGDRERVFETRPIEMEITPTLEANDQNPSQPKPQFQMQTVPFWLIGCIVLLFLSLLIWFLWRRFRHDPQDSSFELPARPPLEEVQMRLRELTSGTTLKEGRFKEFYVEISVILRHFFGRVFDLPGDEMTSFEFENYFQSASVPGEFRVTHQDFSELCDRVKFAKYEPTEAENAEVVNMAFQMIQHLKPLCREEETDVANS